MGRLPPGRQSRAAFRVPAEGLAALPADDDAHRPPLRKGGPRLARRERAERHLQPEQRVTHTLQMVPPWPDKLLHAESSGIATSIWRP